MRVPSFLLLVCALALGFAGAAAGLSPTRGDIAGTLRDSRTNKAIANATVRIFGGPQEGSARTDGDGAYRLADLLPGDYDLLLQKPGYVAQHKTVVVTANAVTTQDGLLEWGDLTRGAIEVRVQDRSRNPLPGAVVDVLAAGVLQARSETDEIGVVVFPGAAPGVYDVQVRRAGYVGSAGRASVRAGNASVASFRLQRNRNEIGRLSGTVRNTAGQTLAGVRVRILDGLSGGQVTTPGNGRFDFPGLIPGDNYALEVSAAGYQTQVRGNLRVRSLSQTVADFFLVPVQPSRGSITGRVSDGEDDPLAFATVRISAGPGLGTEVLTGADGRYTLTNLLPGSYGLVAELSGFNPAGRAGLVVEAGRTRVADFQLTQRGQPLGGIGGLVREAGTGLLLGDVVVEVLIGPSAGITAQSDASGNYLLAGLRPGEGYTVRFRRDGYQSLSQPLVVVNPGVVTTLNVQLSRQSAATAGLRGTVRRYGAGPLASVRVLITSGPTSPVETATDATGAFAFANLRPGAGYALRFEKKGFAALTRTNVTLGDGQTLNLGEFLMRRAVDVGTLRGSVVDLLNRPIPGARVRILAGPSTADDILTPANGTFEFTALIPGTYTLEASANGFVTRQRGFLNVGAGQVTNAALQLLPAN